MIVIDASVLANVVGDDGSDGQIARRELRRASEIAAPNLVDIETVAVLRKRRLAGAISDNRFASAVDDAWVLIPEDGFDIGIADRVMRYADADSS